MFLDLWESLPQPDLDFSCVTCHFIVLYQIVVEGIKLFYFKRFEATYTYEFHWMWLFFLCMLGTKYKDDCPREDMIPIYLIVAGAVLIFRNLSSMCTRTYAANNNDDATDGEDERNPVHKCCDSVLDLFTFCWFIAGNYWIYHINEPSYNHNDGDDYCNKTLYLFAFWITTCTYIFAGFLCCCLCCVGICVAASSDDND